MAEHLTFNQRVRGSNPRCLTTPEQSPLCSGLFFCLWLQNKPSAHFPTPLSAKGHARPTCSVANALAAALVATNLLQVHVYFKTFCRRLYKTERVLPVPFFLLFALTSKDNAGPCPAVSPCVRFRHGPLSRSRTPAAENFSILQAVRTGRSAVLIFIPLSKRRQDGYAPA